MGSIEAVLDDVVSIMEQLYLFSYDDDLLDSVIKERTDISLEGSFRANMEALEAGIEVITALLNHLTVFRDHADQDQFWDRISSDGHSPAIFQVFCFGLLNQSPPLIRLGSLIYATLLGMQPLALLWNSRIFNSLLSIMISASQALEGPDAITGDDVANARLSGELLDVLGHAICPAFQTLAGIDVVLALIELAVKMCTIYQKDADKISAEVSPQAFRFLRGAASSNLDTVQPFLVLALLLGFLPPARSVTAPIAQIRDAFVRFTADILADLPDRLLLITKHVLLRAPERVQMRESAALVAHSLIQSMPDQSPAISFLLKMLKASKAAPRMVALDVFRFLVQGAQLSDEISVNLVQSIRDSISDQNAGVRATAIAVLSALLPTASSRILETISIESLVAALRCRVLDEKLNVRKASLKCLRGILGHSPNFEVMELVANRTRDLSVSVRQEAAQILSYCLTYFDGSEIVSLWFDSILPMALDADSKTQELALKLFDEHILSAIGGAGRRRIEFLSSSHLDLLRKVIPIYRQNSMNLRHVCSNLERLLDVDAEAVLWDLAEIVSGVTPEHFRGEY
jgi:condensin-2 complex subunit D3